MKPVGYIEKAGESRIRKARPSTMACLATGSATRKASIFARRLDVGVDDPDPLPAFRKHRREVPGSVRLPRATTKRVHAEDHRHAALLHLPGSGSPFTDD